MGTVALIRYAVWAYSSAYTDGAAARGAARSMPVRFLTDGKRDLKIALPVLGNASRNQFAAGSRSCRPRLSRPQIVDGKSSDSSLRTTPSLSST